MRKVTIFGLVTVLVVGVTMATVNAEPSSPKREANTVQPRVPDRLRRAESSIRAIQPPTCDPRVAVDRYVKCLNRYLTKLANGVNEAIETFDTFFQCTSYLPVTQYGDLAGTFGYVFDPGTGVTFKTTGLDITEDLANDPFLNHYVVRPTARCIEFAQ